MVGRAGTGTFYVRIGAAEAVEQLRSALDAPCVLLDAPADVRARLDPWDVAEGGELTLARRLKERFDPARACNPGLFVGGI